MSHGRGIRLFLADGTPNGLLTAEIMNWTGHALTGPRTKLAELVKRPECSRTGVYFLVGPDPENNIRPLVYIGESDDVAGRLKQHNLPEEGQHGKDFWERVCLITSKDDNLTKAHIKYIESQLIAIAKSSGQCKLVNETAHNYTSLPEADQADMAFFIEQIRIILPVLGFDFLRKSATLPEEVVSDTAAPIFEMVRQRDGLKARAQEVNGSFFVLEGSHARDEWQATNKGSGYKNLYDQLVQDGVLSDIRDNKREFLQAYEFTSPSAAAAVVAGNSANGRTEWTLEGTGKSYAVWQNEQVEQINIKTSFEKES